MKKISVITPLFLVLVTLSILNSCVNDLDSIQKVTYDPKAPDEVTKNLRVFYTDSGYARVEIFASLAETYSFIVLRS